MVTWNSDGCLFWCEVKSFHQSLNIVHSCSQQLRGPSLWDSDVYYQFIGQWIKCDESKFIQECQNDSFRRKKEGRELEKER